MGTLFTFSHRFQVRSTVLFVAEIVSTNFKGTAYRNNYGINLKDDFNPSTKIMNNSTRFFSALRPSALPICEYLREPIYFFSRRSTLIFSR